MNDFKGFKKAAVYIRQSQTSDGSISPELQEKNCRALAKREGWTVTGVYSDIDITGGSTEKREGYKRLIAHYKSGAFDLVLADDLSRLARNVVDSGELHDLIPTATWKEGLQADRLMTDIYSAFNADYLRKIKDRWSDTLTRRLKAGLPASGKGQYGYRRVSADGVTEYTPENPKPKGVLEKYVQHPQEAEILREAYQRYTKGEGVRTICEDFSARNLPSPGPRGWYATGMFDLLDKPFYAGKISYEGQEFPGAHEGILSAPEWKAYKRAREDRKLQTKPRNPKWMLSGLAVCGHCGGKMLSHMARGVPTLQCGTYNAEGKTGCPGMFRKRAKVQQAVWWWLGAHLDEWASAMPTDDEARLAAEKAVADAESVRDAAQGKIDNLISRMVNLGLTDAEVAAPLTGFRAELAEAQAVVDRALAELGSYSPASDVHDQISKGALLMGFEADSDAEPSEAATAQFREALSKIIEKVIVLPPSGTSPRDPNRNYMSEVKVVPRKV